IADDDQGEGIRSPSIWKVDLISCTGSGDANGQAGSKPAVPILALPTSVAFSSKIGRGALIPPRSVQPACSTQRSVTKILPSTVPRTFTAFVLISPRTSACSPSVSVPAESIVPSISPSMRSSFRNLTKPLLETPWERRAPHGVGIKVQSGGSWPTDGLVDSLAWFAGSVLRVP